MVQLAPPTLTEDEARHVILYVRSLEKKSPLPCNLVLYEKWASLSPNTNLIKFRLKEKLNNL